MRLFGISGSTKSIRSSLLDMIMKELIKKGNKLAIVICTKERRLRAIDKDASRYLSLGAEAVIGITPSNTIILTKPRSILDALELIPPFDYVLAEGCDDVPLPRIIIGKKKPHSLASWSPGEPLDNIFSKIESLPSIKVKLTIDDKRIPLKPYIQNVIASIMKGFISTLKGYEQEAKRVSLKMNLQEEC